MSVKDLFVSGIPGETYWQGVRRRIRDGLVIFAEIIASSAVTYGVYRVSGSVLLTVFVAAVSGFVSGFSDLSIIRAQNAPPTHSDKVLWVLWFAPSFALLAAGLAYILSGGILSKLPPSAGGVDLMGAFFIAWTLGSLTFATCEVLLWSREIQ